MAFRTGRVFLPDTDGTTGLTQVVPVITCHVPTTVVIDYHFGSYSTKATFYGTAAGAPTTEDDPGWQATDAVFRLDGFVGTLYAAGAASVQVAWHAWDEVGD